MHPCHRFAKSLDTCKSNEMRERESIRVHTRVVSKVKMQEEGRDAKDASDEFIE